jgi:hypothetical protein
MDDIDPRIFVEWYDDKRPGWGGYVSTLDRDFVQAVNENFSEFGPPTKVEFRIGWKKVKTMGGDPHDIDESDISEMMNQLDPQLKLENLK